MESQGTVWKTHSVAMRDKLGVSAKYAPWSARPDVYAAKLLSPRYKDVIDIAWTAHVQQSKAEAQRQGQPQPSDSDLRQGFFVDIGQAVQRRPWHRGPLRTICQGSAIYSYEADGVLRPQQLLRLQGLGTNLRVSRLSDNEIRSLAGEGFTWPCIASALWAAYLEPEAPWWKGPAPQ